LGACAPSCRASLSVLTGSPSITSSSILD
jgi:hypothetical protein